MKMEWTGWNDGKQNRRGCGYGFRIGKKYRDDIFDTGWSNIFIEFNGEHCEAKITKGFWKNCPEVRAEKLGEWLVRLNLAPWPKGKPPRISVIQTSENSFSVEEINRHPDA